MTPRFFVDVSRDFTGKAGQHKPGALNASFKTEQHDPQSFLDIIRAGFPYTGRFAKRPPSVTEADKRGIKTARHRENFQSSSTLTWEDDSAAPGVVDWWKNDKLFKRLGFAIPESDSSRPGAEKAHLIILLDKPITSAGLYQECIQALLWHYRDKSGLDTSIHDPLRIWFNSKSAKVHEIGNICPWSTFEREILKPFRKAKQRQQKRQRKPLSRSRKPASDKLGRYTRARVDGALAWLSDAPEGMRNIRLNWASHFLAGLYAADWTDPRAFDQIESELLSIAQGLGLAEGEILKTIKSGWSAGLQQPADPPAERDPLPAGGTTTGQQRPALPPLVRPSLNHPRPTPELCECERTIDKIVYNVATGRGRVTFFCNDKKLCDACQQRAAQKLSYYLDLVARFAFIDEHGKLGWSLPEESESGEWSAQQRGPGFWWGAVLPYSERPGLIARYKAERGFQPEIYPLRDGEAEKILVLSLTPFEDLQPIELTEDLLRRVVAGAAGRRSFLRLAPSVRYLEMALPQYTFQIPSYLVDKGIITDSVEVSGSIVFNAPLVEEGEIYVALGVDWQGGNVGQQAESVEDINLALEEIALKSVDFERLRGIEDREPDFIIKRIHIAPGSEKTFCDIFNAQRTGDKTTVDQHRLKLPRLRSVEKSKGIGKPPGGTNTIPLDDSPAPDPPESWAYVAQIERMLRLEAV